MKGISWHIWAIGVMCIIVVCVIGISHQLKPPQKVQEIPRHELASLDHTEKIANQVRVKESTAREIQIQATQAKKEHKAIERYTATSVEEVKVKEEKSLPANNVDRVVISEDTDEKVVDVYRISLKKEHKIKAGMTVIDRKPFYNVGYQAGRFEGIMHTDGSKVRGATVMYTVMEW